MKTTVVLNYTHRLLRKKCGTYHEHALVAVDDADEDVHMAALAVLIPWDDQHVVVTVRTLHV